MFKTTELRLFEMAEFRLFWTTEFVVRDYIDLVKFNGNVEYQKGINYKSENPYNLYL